MPPATVLPEPELLVTTGTSLLGLNPTPGLVPAGERAKWICAACVDRVTANKRIKDVFMGIVITTVLVVGCLWWELNLVITHQSWSSKFRGHLRSPIR